MDNYGRQTTTLTAANQFSTFDSQLDYSQDLQYTTPNDDYWCDTCSLSYGDCLCYAASPVSTHQSYAGYETPNSKSYTYSQTPYPTTYSTSSASSTSSYYTSSASSQHQSSYSAIAPAQTPGSGNGAHDSTPTETSPKRGKRKGSMPPAEAREKRLEQNRRSQRSFRDRQARLVVDLKQKVEILTEENQKLANELSGLKISRDSNSPGGYSNY
ncbi:uncharacterized protein PAC_04446 [Phialocephala subalpina]|uniref:BZIP domain-containing protein n=1 Tax=Phialocephala subalpina TaxID=576137 RepID=A0A1L7WP75_9HELO|nr:uncharacterized protein PAC_04446 [Phialocephala subalpina]